MYPQIEGKYFIHVLIGNQEIKQSPVEVTIVKSDKHLELDAEALAKLKLDKQNALDAKANKLKGLKDKEANKLKALKDKEEALRKKREET